VAVVDTTREHRREQLVLLDTIVEGFG